MIRSRAVAALRASTSAARPLARSFRTYAPHSIRCTAPVAELKDPRGKYIAPPTVDLPDRRWPNQTLKEAPRWLSSDLRDGNQSLINPMSIEQKTRFFNMLVKMGFKEIEVAFPAASEIDFGFVRGLVESGSGAEEGVWFQVLTPAREDLIRRTFASLKGSRRGIIHMYNATSPIFRKTVFNNSKQQTIDLAVKHAALVRDLIDREGHGTEWQFQYSPETFSQTEPEFAVEICNAVQDTWFEGKDRKTARPLIFNLPATVEVSTPNVYADQVEYFHRNIKNRENVVISLHCHNDRGTGVAATELGLLAGGDRVEGCMFGNGERTGNVDLATVALNYYTHGIHPQLDLSDLYSIIETVTDCNDLPVHPRHPYAGELVFTAFSGSHQDAIKKGFAAQRARGDGPWEVPYIPVDPQDIGMTYEAVIRVNSQSGKGGVAYLVQQKLGLDLPRKLQVGFYQVVQDLAERTGKEMTTEDIERAFRSAYHYGHGYEGRFVYLDHRHGAPDSVVNSYDADLASSPLGGDVVAPPSSDGKIAEAVTLGVVSAQKGGRRTRQFTVRVRDNQTRKEVDLVGFGNGPLSAVLDALAKQYGIKLSIREYSEAAIGQGSDVKAAGYVELIEEEKNSKDEKVKAKAKGWWGVGVDEDVTAASLKAVLSAASSVVVSDEEKMGAIQERTFDPNAPVSVDAKAKEVTIKGATPIASA